MLSVPGGLYMYVISYGGTSSHNMQLTEFGIPTSINIGRYAPDTIILEMRSEVLNMLCDTPPSQDASTRQIYDSYLK